MNKQLFHYVCTTRCFLKIEPSTLLQLLSNICKPLFTKKSTTLFFSVVRVTDAYGLVDLQNVKDPREIRG